MFLIENAYLIQSRYYNLLKFHVINGKHSDLRQKSVEVRQNA